MNDNNKNSRIMRTGNLWAAKLIRMCVTGGLLVFCAAVFGAARAPEQHNPSAQPTDIRFQRLLTGDQPGESDNISAITSIVQDATGFMWFGGENGLARYNGMRFDIFHTDPQQPNSLSGNYILDLAVDNSGVLWVATSQGLSRYNPDRHDFSRFSSTSAGPGIDPSARLTSDVLFSLAVAPDNSIYLGSSRGLYRLNPQRTGFEGLAEFRDREVREVFIDRAGGLWVGTAEHGLFYRGPDSTEFRNWIYDPAEPRSLPHNSVRAIEQDIAGHLWVGTQGGGLGHLDKNLQYFANYRHDAANPASIASDSIRDLHLDRSGQLWVAADDGGLALYEASRDDFRIYRHSAQQPNSLSSNRVRAIYDDQQGDLWVGVFPAGIHYFDRSTALFTNYAANPPDPASLSHSAVLRFYGDRRGTLWVGTEGGLNAFDLQSNTFTRYLADPTDAQALQAGTVLALTEDRDENLWVGTWGGGLHKLDRATSRFQNYRPREGDSHSLGDAYVWSLLGDSGGRIWVGTEYSGLHLYRPETDNFWRYSATADDPESLSSRHVWALLEDRQQRLWVGTTSGLDLLVEFGPERARFRHFRHNPDDPATLSSNRIVALHEDSRGALWVGTQDAGLNRLDPATGQVVRVQRGLPANQVSSIQEDKQGFIWVSTVNGLAMIHPETFAVRSFSESNGLVTDNFNRDASFRDQEGRLYFGGVDGFSVFAPIDFHTPPVPPKVVITDFRLFNRPVYAGMPGSPLRRAISVTDELQLSHHHTMFAFDFMAVSYRATQNNQFAYKLEGFDADWNMVGGANTATYTNLDPGRYQFRVRAANSDGVWNEEGATLALVITPPPWRTWWAYLIYAALTVFGVGAIVRYQRHKTALHAEQALNQKLIKLDRLKDAFLANTSHELRTPLNGIIGLAEALQDGSLGDVSGGVRSALRMISSSGRRLSGLINDILDFARLNERQLEVHLAEVQLRTLIDSVFILLRPLIDRRLALANSAGLQTARAGSNARAKPLYLVNDVPPDLWVLADEDRLQQILLNLVGNAIKFTERGHVRVYARTDAERCRIAVEDTGPGIAPQDLSRIFTAFTQLDNADTRAHGGTGLGLAIARQLVELHGGSLQAESQVGIGSTFLFCLAICSAPTAEEMNQRAQAPEKLLPIVTSEREDTLMLLRPPAHERQYTILIVDDDAVNRMVLASMLALQNYTTIEVENGPAALHCLAQNSKIDLIVMDVMMPKMSGYETCMRIRVTHPVHALPVLFLTAKNFCDDLVRGFVAGGNDFLTKPVAKHELLSRVSTHLSLLEINRGLEQKYQAACYENRNISRELHALEQIVGFINQEQRPEPLLRDTLAVVRDLISADRVVYWQAQPGGLTVDFTPEPEEFRLFDDLGGNLPAPDTSSLTAVSARLREWQRADQSIWILDELAGGDFQLVRTFFPTARSAILMTIYFETGLVGFLTMLSQQPQGFNSTTVTELQRLLAHITSAAIKANQLQSNGNGRDAQPIARTR